MRAPLRDKFRQEVEAILPAAVDRGKLKRRSRDRHFGTRWQVELDPRVHPDELPSAISRKGLSELAPLLGAAGLEEVAD